MPRLILEQEQPLLTLQVTLDKKDGEISLYVKKQGDPKVLVLTLKQNGTCVRSPGIPANLELDLDPEGRLIVT